MKTHTRMNSLHLSSLSQNTVQAVMLGKSGTNAASVPGARALDLMKENRYPQHYDISFQSIYSTFTEKSVCVSVSCDFNWN